jgi:hypothetical protein
MSYMVVFVRYPLHTNILSSPNMLIISGFICKSKSVCDDIIMAFSLFLWFYCNILNA